MTELFLDIETAPPSGAALVELEKSIFFRYPDTNSPRPVAQHRGLKDPEKIAVYQREGRERAEHEWREHNRSQRAKRAEALAASALDGAIGHIVSLSWSINDEPARVSVQNGGSFGEREVIESFVELISRLSTPTVVAHFAQFDVRFIWQRCIINSVALPTWWPVAARPWDSSRVRDTMIEWAGVGKNVSLNALCRALDVPGKGAVNGGDVFSLWREARYGEIGMYNRDNVRRLRCVARRMSGRSVLEIDISALTQHPSAASTNEQAA